MSIDEWTACDKAPKNNRSKWMNLLHDFYDSGEKAIYKDFDSEGDARKFRNKFDYSVKHCGFGCAVHLRGKRVYIERTDL